MTSEQTARHGLREVVVEEALKRMEADRSIKTLVEAVELVQAEMGIRLVPDLKLVR